MFQGQISPIHQALIARSSIWLTCPDCEDTTRVLALMAGRVLKERRQCPKCLSTHPLHMSLTRAGAHIPASEAHHAPSNEQEETYLRTWIERDDQKSRACHWFGLFGRWLATRFSRPRREDTQIATTLADDEHGLDLATAKDKM